MKKNRITVTVNDEKRVGVAVILEALLNRHEKYNGVIEAIADAKNDIEKMVGFKLPYGPWDKILHAIADLEIKNLKYEKQNRKSDSK